MSKVRRSGTGLAVDIPADLADRLGIKEGDEVEVRKTHHNTVELIRKQDRKAAIERLLNLTSTLPADFKFDRDEANER